MVIRVAHSISLSREESRCAPSFVPILIATEHASTPPVNPPPGVTIGGITPITHETGIRHGSIRR